MDRYEDILISFLGAEFIRNNVQLSGFGGAAYGNLYKVNLDVGGILYPNMHIVANDLKSVLNLFRRWTLLSAPA